MYVNITSENRTGLYIAVSTYVTVLLLGATWWAYRRTKQMKHQGVGDDLYLHYLGGRSFGPVLTAASLFATLFSGYTFVGVPNESFESGFQAFRWLATVAAMTAGIIGTGVRLRKVSLVRNHQSPVDFLTDRYRSQYLRYTIVFIQIVAGLIYMAAQVNALRSTLNSMFEYRQTKQKDTAWPVILAMGIMVFSEWMGGMNSVVLTDCVQAVIMVLSCILLPLVIFKNFGGWADLDFETYPRMDFYQTPSKDSQLQFWEFSLVNMGFFALPHLLTRIYAARDMKSLKAGCYTLSVAPWLTMIAGVFVGTIGVQILNDAGISDTPNPFTAIVNEVMDLGGFAKGVGVISLVAAIAAIMSTADSLLLALSHLLATEFVYPLVPDSSPFEVSWLGRFVSLTVAFLALAAGFLWEDGITDLAKINFSVSAQVVPSFLVGLYANTRFDIHPWCLATGAHCSVAYIFVIYFYYIKTHEDHVPIDPGLSGLAVQIATTCTLELCRRLAGGTQSKKTTPETARPSWDTPLLERFGEGALTPKLLNEMMEGVAEPFNNRTYVLLFFFLLSMVTPIVPGGQPVRDSFREFASEVPIVNGLPWWVFKQLLICIVPYAMIVAAVYRTNDKFPLDMKKLKNRGINPDVVELTSWELGERSKYDGPNEYVCNRRSKIRNKMIEEGLELECGVEDGELDETKTLLVELVQGGGLGGGSGETLPGSDRT